MYGTTFNASILAFNSTTFEVKFRVKHDHTHYGDMTIDNDELFVISSELDIAVFSPKDGCAKSRGI